MSEYILLIQGNTETLASPEEWAEFFEIARKNGTFVGGSEIGERTVIGNAQTHLSTDQIVGYMRFDTDDKQGLIDLIKTHPVVHHGGTVELCELPRT